MCVICIKPRKVAINPDTLLEMFEANPHGAGLAVVFPHETVISKGYMDIDSLWADIETLQTENLIVHFRWATHGLINEPMTHPFLVTKDLEKSTELFSRSSLPVLVHNGIIHGYGNDSISDTADFTVNVLAHLPSTKARKKLLELTNSKFVLVEDGKIIPIGKFYRHKKLIVSNLDFVYSMPMYSDNYLTEYNYEDSSVSGKVRTDTRNSPLQSSFLPRDTSSCGKKK